MAPRLVPAGLLVTRLLATRLLAAGLLATRLFAAGLFATRLFAARLFPSRLFLTRLFLTRLARHGAIWRVPAGGLLSPRLLAVGAAAVGASFALRLRGCRRES